MKNIYTKNVKENLNYVDNNKIGQRQRKNSLPVPIFVFPPNILVFLDLKLVHFQLWSVVSCFPYHNENIQ